MDMVYIQHLNVSYCVYWNGHWARMYIMVYWGDIMTNIWWLDRVNLYRNRYWYMFIVFVIVVSFPVFISGIFIFIPTTIIMVIIEMVIVFAVFFVAWGGKKRYLNKDGMEAGFGSAFAALFLGLILVYWSVIVMRSTMEFYDDSDWPNHGKLDFGYCAQMIISSANGILWLDIRFLITVVFFLKRY